MTTTDWTARSARTRRGRRNTLVIGVAGAAIGTPLFLIGSRVAGAAGIALGIAGAALIAIALVYGTIVYMRRIDEQERAANLWAAYVGVNTYAGLFVFDMLARAIGFPGIAPITIFLLTALVVVSIFLWLRFR